MPKPKMMSDYQHHHHHQNHSSPLPSCFSGGATTNSVVTPTKDRSQTASSRPFTANPHIATCLYHTSIGLIALTWSRTLFGRSLHLHLLSSPTSDDDGAAGLSFHLHIKPFVFWNKHGSKTLPLNSSTATTKPIRILWDLSRAKFGSGPEPKSGFYIAVVSDGKMTLLAGDSPKDAFSKSKVTQSDTPQTMVMRREHVYGAKLYVTKANFGGRTRQITIDCRIGESDPRLYFAVDGKRVLQIKHLKWKFRGNERVMVDGVHVQISWDVHNWLFETDDEDGFAPFIFRFETPNCDEYESCYESQLSSGEMSSLSFGFEAKKMKKMGLLGMSKARSSSSLSSLSSASSSCSSVLEWASVEENELKGPSGFSLMVYAWKG